MYLRFHPKKSNILQNSSGDSPGLCSTECWQVKCKQNMHFVLTDCKCPIAYMKCSSGWISISGGYCSIKVELAGVRSIRKYCRNRICFWKDVICRDGLWKMTLDFICWISLEIMNFQVWDVLWKKKKWNKYIKNDVWLELLDFQQSKPFSFASRAVCLEFRDETSRIT